LFLKGHLFQFLNSSVEVFVVGVNRCFFSLKGFVVLSYPVIAFKAQRENEFGKRSSDRFVNGLNKNSHFLQEKMGAEGEKDDLYVLS